MKCIKLIGLAAVMALALAAILGTDAASATVLCKTLTSPCSASYPTEAKIEDKASEGGPSALLEDGLSFSTECPRQTLVASIADAGSSTKTVSLTNEYLLIVECPWPGRIAFAKFGSMDIHYTAEGDGTVTAGGIRVLYEDTETNIKCWYEMSAGSHFGTLDGGSESVIQVDTTLERIEGSGLLCGAEAHWTGAFQITAPTPLYVAAS